MCTVGFLSRPKILALGSWNVELGQIFLINWIADYFVTHACCVDCLFYSMMENTSSMQLEF